MTIRFYNTLTGEKQTLQPLEQGSVKMYCCGVTPYDSTHLGHTRTFFSYDLLYRVLVDQGFSVAWARNITDIDDKILKKAQNEGIACADVVRRYVAEQDEMLSLFHLLRPRFEPRVTENIPQIQGMIAGLVQRGIAYVTASGVYYRVHRFPDYGKLSKNKVQDLKQGARVEVDETKEDPIDFCLWKFAKEGEEVRWDSPWGAGRPGWHVECSAMIHSLFGDAIDIHMGGRDLIFPHHECEIAQSEGLTGRPLAQIWMHTGMVTLYGEKMSKSANHFVAIKDFLATYPAEVLRLLFLSVSYSQPLDFTFALAQENLKKLSKLYRFVGLLDDYALAAAVADQREQEKNGQCADPIFANLEATLDRMRACLVDDLGSVSALAVLFDFIKNVNSGLAALEKTGKHFHPADRLILQEKWPQLKTWIRNTLGLLLVEPQAFFAGLQNDRLAGAELSLEQIKEKIQERQKARLAKDWQKADVLRDELLTFGVCLQDTPRGTRWTVEF